MSDEVVRPEPEFIAPRQDTVDSTLPTTFGSIDITLTSLASKHGETVSGAQFEGTPMDQALAGAVNDNTRAVFVVTPHNPSGTVNTNDTFKRFLRDTAARTLVVVDEAYLEFTPDFTARSAVISTSSAYF